MASFELSGSVSEQDKTFIETWENVSEAVNYIVRENRRGDEEYLGVQGKRQFKLSTYDRMLTEDKVRKPQDNPFKNGCFRPVVVPENVTIETNPNAMSSDDIRKLFSASQIAWDEYMDVIDSPATLSRMLSMADSGEADLTHRRYKQLELMHQSYTSRGKPVLAQNDPDIERFSGSTNEPISVPSKRGPGRPPKAAQ